MPQKKAKTSKPSSRDAEFIHCPHCKKYDRIVMTDYEDEDGEIEDTGRRCDSCGWEGDSSELVCLK